MAVFNLFTKHFLPNYLGILHGSSPIMFSLQQVQRLPENSHSTIYIGRLDFKNNAAQCRLICRNVQGLMGRPLSVPSGLHPLARNSASVSFIMRFVVLYICICYIFMHCSMLYLYFINYITMLLSISLPCLDKGLHSLHVCALILVSQRVMLVHGNG